MPTAESATERLQLAGMPMRAVVRQCLTHVQSATEKLPQRMERASARTAYGEDRQAVRSNRFPTAFEQRLMMTQDATNGLISQLRGLDYLLNSEIFLPTPAVSIVRSVVEISATTAWLLRADVSLEDRAARAYACAFRGVEKADKALSGSSDLDLPGIREKLVQHVRTEGAIAVRRVKNGVPQLEVASVDVGKSHARVEFNYSQRIAHEIPRMQNLYSALSGIVHGEQIHLSSAWETPDALARLIGRVTQWSVQAWSDAVHGWVGVEHGRFVNRADLADLLATTPDDHKKLFGAPDLD